MLTPMYISTPSHACDTRTATTTRFPNNSDRTRTPQDQSTSMPSDILSGYAHGSARVPGKRTRVTKAAEALPPSSRARGRTASAYDRRPPLRRPSVFEQLSRPYDAPKASRSRAQSHRDLRRRHGLGADDRCDDGHSHGARKAAG